jgi:hypothetical protein
VGGAVLDGPVLQRAGDDVGERGVERLGLRDRPAQRAVDILGQPGALHFIVERERAKVVTRPFRLDRDLVVGRTPLADVTNGVA